MQHAMQTQCRQKIAVTKSNKSVHCHCILASAFSRFQHLTDSVLAGPHRDEALIRACADMAAMKSHVAALPDWLRSLFTAPAGSVNLLAVPSLDLLEGTVTPLRKSMAAFERVLPIDCIFSPESITPLRHAHILSESINLTLRRFKGSESFKSRTGPYFLSP